MNERAPFFRLLLGLCLLALLLVSANVYLGTVPVLGHLPGDLEIDFPGGFVYLPVTTSVLLAVIITVLALLLTTTSKNDY